MAKAGSSSRFVSVNLSKSYGQPSSSSPSHGSSSSSVSGSSSSGFRARLQSGHSGMVILSRPGRSQPSVSSISSRTSKLAVPRPVNLPSLRREHGGNDPPVPLPGISGSARWSKQQVMSSTGNGMATLQSIPADSAAVGSSSRIPESSWNFPSSQAKAIPSSEGENMEQRVPFHISGASSNQAPLARASLYTPPGSRNSNAVSLHPIQHAAPREKAMIVRGEDFPTLQAAVRPLSVPAIQRQRDMQQKHQNKQHELKDQHFKLQQLSQQQNMKADVLQLEQYTGPPLQPARPQQALSKQSSTAEGLSYDAYHAVEKGANKLYRPSPLTRLNHTSNWGDDERETLQSAHGQGSRQSDRLESGRPRNNSQFSDSWALDHKVDNDTGRPTSRNGSASAYGRDHRDLRDHNRNGSFIYQGRSTRDLGLSNGPLKGFSNQQFDVDSWEDITSWSRGPARNDSSKQDWGYTPKEVISNKDARFGNLNRSFNSKNMGLTRDNHTNALRDGNISHRGDNLGTDKFTRDVHLRDGSSRVNANSSKQGVDDRQGDRFGKNVAGYHYGRSDTFSASRVRAGTRTDLSGLDYGREKRLATLYGQDAFTDEPRSLKSGQSLVFEAFVGYSGFEAKITKKRKDELPSFHDPARELFEAELERVQKMQEQERQRLAEERERAIELARKEEEERERLAREEELLRLKLEEEAREAAVQARREQEEAARKAEETRRAREEQKRMVMLEEERRKEAARRKLIELEQRIALRKSGRVASAGSLERGTIGDVVMHDEHRGIERLNEFDKNEDCVLSRGPLSVQPSVRKELMSMSGPLPLENSMMWPSDSRGGEESLVDRIKVAEKKRRETVDDGLGLHSTMKNYHRDIPSDELDRRSFSSRDLSTGPTRSFPVGASQSSSIARRQDRVPADRFSRDEHWQSGVGNKFSGDHLSTHLSTDINTGYMDSENDGWWGRDNQRKFQEWQRLDSPPLFSYMNGGESDYPSSGRLRQSLPKQPKVPPPIFRRPSSHKQVIQSESTQAVPSKHNDSEDVSKDGINFSSREVTSGRNPEKSDCVHRPLIEAPSVERSVSASSNEMIVSPSLTTKVLNGGSEDVSETCKDEISQPDEIDQLSEQLSDLTESEEQSREDEKQAAVDMQVSEAAAYADEEDGWVVLERLEDIVEERCVKEEGIGEAAEDDLEDRAWDSSKNNIDAKSSLAHVTEGEIEDSTWESQDEGNGVVCNPEGASDSQWERDQAIEPKTDKQDEKHDERNVENSGPREVVRGGHVELQNNLSSANVLEYVHAGQSEGHHHVHSFIQQFQQPFSFMAVPLPQSTTMNGVPLHPPLLPSMHNLQMQQELPYSLQMGLFPSAPPLMPNAIQIGSIQMPLQVHPQMASVAHHHQQPPVFQFGQICQFSQPVPPMQPTFQMQHALGQPLLAQHHQTDLMSPKESSQLANLNNPVREEVVSVGPSPGPSVSVDGPAVTLLDGSLVSKDHMDQNLGSSLVSAPQTSLPSVKLGPHQSPTPDVGMDDEIKQDTSTFGKITGGRRRSSNARSFGIYGRGRGRSSGPYSVVGRLPESLGKDTAQTRSYRPSYRRAEYKIRKPPVTSNENGSKFGLDQENHNLSYGDVAYGLASIEGSTIDNRLDLDFYSQSFGSEVQGDKDDFIEVRSKRQLLREQRELRDKAKIEELKVKEQIASKQQKVIRKAVLHEEASMIASNQHPAERWSVLNADLVNNDGRYMKHRASVIGSSLQQFCATPNFMGLSTAAANESKVSKPSQYQSVAVAGHADTVKEHVFGHDYSSDSTPTINAAWGVQKSSHEVVSLTHIQLEEAMRPFGYDGRCSPIAPITEKGPNGLETGNSLVSCSLNKVSAPVKTPLLMPGPISSLLAGEKIQFGAVTSPTVVSSSSHPPSPFVGAIGSQFGSDTAHPLNHARSYSRQDGTDTFLPSKITPRVEEDMNGHVVDVEAEAMAAASAVAVAAISNDEINSYSHANAVLGGGEPVGTLGSFSKSSGLDGTGSGIVQGPSKNLGVDNIALPADLSVETTAAPPQPSLLNHSITPDIMLQHLPSRASPFPGLEMGTILGGPMFAYGPPEDAALSSFEPGLGGLGAGNVGGWQHRLSNTSDSFYGAPPHFMNPIQGHPHMLVYSHPFTPGQFGQLGVSFMGTTYHPSGKQPDWTHTPYPASPASMMNQSGGDVNAGRPAALDVQHSALASNSPQANSGSGCSMMPVHAPMSVFDPNFPSPFQAQWSRASAPSFSNYHIAGPAPGLSLQPRPGELGVFSPSMHVSGNLQQLPETSGSLLVSTDAAAAGVHFPKELGFGCSSDLVGDDVEMVLNRGHSTERGEVFNGRLQQAQSLNGNPNLASSSSQNELRLSSQDSRSSSLENTHAQSSELDHHQVLGHPSSLVDIRANSNTSSR